MAHTISVFSAALVESHLKLAEKVEILVETERRPNLLHFQPYYEPHLRVASFSKYQVLLFCFSFRLMRLSLLSSSTSSFSQLIYLSSRIVLPCLDL